MSAQPSLTFPYGKYGKSLPEWVVKRAGGRRRYNAQRQRAAAARRHQVAEALIWNDESQAEVARKFHVNRSTICRDAQAIGGLIDPAHGRCPYCRQIYAGGRVFNKRPCPTLADEEK